MRTLAVVVTSALVMGIASLVYLWPTVSWLHPAAARHLPRLASYASYDVIPESASDAFVLVRPPGGGLLSATNLYRTRDAGISWHRVTLPPLPIGVAIVVTRLPQGQLFLRSFGFSTGAQQFAIGDGTTWTPIVVPDQGTGSLQMIDARLGFYVFTQTAGTPSIQELLIYRTVDGGQSWEQRLALTADRPDGGGLHLSDDNRFVTFSDATHGWLVLVPPTWGIVCGKASTDDSVEQLLASHDGGAHWSSTSLPALPLGSTGLGPPVFPDGGAAGFLIAIAHTYVRECPPAGTTYAYRTLDNGATWSGPRILPGPYFDSRNGLVWWASDGRQIFRSTNQGQDWQTSKPKLPAAAVTLIELFAVDGRTAWSLWSGEKDQAQSQPQPQVLLRTTDAGARWSEVKLPGG